MENVKNIIKNYGEQIDSLEKQIKQVQNQIYQVSVPYKEELLAFMSEKIAKGERFYFVHNGMIMVQKVNNVYVSGVSGATPRVAFECLFLRSAGNASYLYHSQDDGFLIMELQPIAKETFLEELRKHINQVVENLSYKPTAYFREMGDVFDKIIIDCRRVGIDVEYQGGTIKVEIL
jgi:hypothetical protein